MNFTYIITTHTSIYLVQIKEDHIECDNMKDYIRGHLDGVLVFARRLLPGSTELDRLRVACHATWFYYRIEIKE